ncbi:MAG: hypothetical protein EB168_05790 [Euryarchaeota archaeon]|nr:hypothetical protein [Euryarchaeota archaeon]
MPPVQPPGDVGDPDGLSPESLGFMCGIEIHQQLSSGKLHSRQDGILYEVNLNDIPGAWKRVRRKLRAARGEGGEIDVAAAFEQKRNRSFTYIQTPNSGLIELDEAPPLPLDPVALATTLQISAMLDATPAPHLQVMRKTVVDGSNTSGFQRTTLVATDGKFEVEGIEVGISVICLEEDSARKLGEETNSDGQEVTYSLDRLGIPLVEIATDPDIVSPEHAEAVSRYLGGRLRDTRRVRRGLGSIRQDLNVSIACGDRVEIKGCQDLAWIPRIIRIEMARQLYFFRLSNKLRSAQGYPLLPDDRRLDDEETEAEIRCSVEQILAGGITDIKEELEGSGAAKRAGVKGIIHSDELPGYGISQSHVDSIRLRLGTGEDDAFAICIAPEWQARLSLDSVLARARMAYHRIPKEVRNVVLRKGQPEDGTTMALRPLPGGARMYPETDIPVLELDGDLWLEAKDAIPMDASKRLDRLISTGLSSSQSEAILGAQLDDILFDCARGAFHDLPPQKPQSIATALLDQTIGEASEKAGIHPEEFPILSLVDAIHARDQEVITREGVTSIASLHAKNLDIQQLSLDQRIDWIHLQAEAMGFIPANESDVSSAIDEIILENISLINARGEGSIGPLMGKVMGKLGGAADGKVVSRVLREKITSVLQKE